MLGQVTVRVDAPPSAAPTTTAPATVPLSAPPSAPAGPSAALPLTGFDLTAVLGVAAVFIAVGNWCIQASRRLGRREPMSFRPRRTYRSMRYLAATGTAMVLVLALALPGGAQTGVTVQATQGPSSRQFFVETLAGQPLTALTLPAVGVLQPFRVRVVDTNVLATSGFTVDARLNNLYKKNGQTLDYGVKIPANDVELGFLTNPVDGLLGAMGVQGLFGLTGQLGNCSATTTQVTTLLGGVLTDQTVISALASLCTALNGGTAAINNLPVAGSIYSITPTVTGLANLPLELTGQDPGRFSNADYADGTIGAGDTAGKAGAPAPTVRGMLSGLPLTQLPQTLLDNLTAQLQALVGSLPDMTVEGVNAKSSVEGVIAALISSTDPALQAYGSLLSTLSGNQAIQLVQGLTDYALSLVPLTDILSVAGTYMAFPGLRLAAPAPQPGSYEGTMTVTFVQS